MRTHSDTIAGLVLLIFCAITLWLTTGFVEVPAMLSQNVPPTFFPRLVLAVIAVLSIALVFRGSRVEPETRSTVEPPVFITAVVIVAAGAAAPLLGTFPVLFLLAIVLPLCWGERRFHLIALLAVFVPVGIYLIFAVALGVRFPPGLVPGLFS